MLKLKSESECERIENSAAKAEDQEEENESGVGGRSDDDFVDVKVLFRGKT